MIHQCRRIFSSACDEGKNISYLEYITRCPSWQLGSNCKLGKFQCPPLLANDWVLVTVVHEQTNGAELHRKEGTKCILFCYTQ
ncbi:hypothetical protein I7I50_01031 [Histoplasma capsulatum G186AR]|uniref:Uncharacterized protein n=1 Tax=Ajellomyces capsulatus TaxID=5037 RepID=A0A8H7YJF3_AJECA|nr:hypothetical protein I7I52_08297 [Histoplasma capsulatum]QSS73011.1 hypothetical protein I7I50_01031 [Histoplasma capsulatum G186AR]